MKRCNCLKSIKEKNWRMRILLTTDNVCIFIRYYKKSMNTKNMQIQRNSNWLYLNCTLARIVIVKWTSNQRCKMMCVKLDVCTLVSSKKHELYTTTDIAWRFCRRFFSRAQASCNWHIYKPVSYTHLTLPTICSV